MIDFLRKYFVLVLLVFLVVVLFSLKIFYGKNSTNETENMIVTPTSIKMVTPTPIIYESDNPDSEKNETTILPYMGKKMQIAGYIKPGVLEVLIRKEEDKEEAKREFEEWRKKYPSFIVDDVVYTVSSELN